MFHYLHKFAFHKNTFGKPFLIRIEFEVNISDNCLLVADNICQCDSWFVKSENVRIKYDVKNSGLFKTLKSKIVRKSIIVDLNKKIDNEGFVELIITNNGGITDYLKVEYSEMQNDFFKNSNLFFDHS
jgi:hypothetical protein